MEDERVARFREAMQAWDAFCEEAKQKGDEALHTAYPIYTAARQRLEATGVTVVFRERRG